MWFNVLQFLDATYIHNYQVIGFTLAALAALYAAIVHPTRRHVLFFVGFLALIIHFEYYKHIVDGLTDQTLTTLFLAEPHYRGRWLTSVFLEHLVPFGLWVVGWGSIVIALLDPHLRRPRR